MQSEFYFQRAPLEESVQPQLSRLLEIKTERASRARYPHLWKLTDRLNSREKAPEAVQEARKKRSLWLGLACWLLGLVLLLPGCMTSRTVLLAAGLIGCLAGAVTLWLRHRKLLAVVSLPVGALMNIGSGLNPQELGGFLLPGILLMIVGFAALFASRDKKSAFEKTALQLIKSSVKERKDPEIVFVADGMGMRDQQPVAYKDLMFFETEDLFVPVFHGEIMILPKKDLQGGTVEEFRKFLEKKSHIETI